MKQNKFSSNVCLKSSNIVNPIHNKAICITKKSMTNNYNKKKMVLAFNVCSFFLRKNKSKIKIEYIESAFLIKYKPKQNVNQTEFNSLLLE